MTGWLQFFKLERLLKELYAAQNCIRISTLQFDEILELHCKELVLFDSSKKQFQNVSKLQPFCFYTIAIVAVRTAHKPYWLIEKD